MSGTRCNVLIPSSPRGPINRKHRVHSHSLTQTPNFDKRTRMYNTHQNGHQSVHVAYALSMVSDLTSTYIRNCVVKILLHCCHCCRTLQTRSFFVGSDSQTDRHQRIWPTFKLSKKKAKESKKSPPQGLLSLKS